MEKSYVIVSVNQRVEEERSLSPDRSVFTSEVNASVKSSSLLPDAVWRLQCCNMWCLN